MRVASLHFVVLIPSFVSDTFNPVVGPEFMPYAYYADFDMDEAAPAPEIERAGLDSSDGNTESIQVRSDFPETWIWLESATG